MTQENTAAAGDNDTNQEAQPDELTLLKNRAKAMGISHSPNIGVDALRKKVNDSIQEGAQTAGADEQPEDENLEEMSPIQKRAAIRARLKRDEMRLVRVRITCMNPTKKEWPGEVLTVDNKYLGTVKKFIPFGEATDEGYHIPHCLLRALKAKKFQQIKTKPDPKNRANVIVTRRLVPEFAIEEMPPLTKEELKKLGDQQRAAQGMD